MEEISKTPKRTVTAREFTEEESKWLELSPVCAKCQHLVAFHNGHCCSFCMVPGCECETDGCGYWDDEKKERVGCVNRDWDLGLIKGTVMVG